MSYPKDIDGFRAFVRAEVAGLVGYVVGLDKNATREEAEDAVHEVLYEALTKWSNLGNPSGWARTAARREYVRARARERERPGRHCRAEDAPPAPTPDEVILRTEQEEAVRKALDLLPPRQAEVLALHYDGYTAAETASILGCSADTVRSNLRHARTRLREDGVPARDRDGTLGSKEVPRERLD